MWAGGRRWENLLGVRARSPPNALDKMRRRACDAILNVTRLHPLSEFWLDPWVPPPTPFAVALKGGSKPTKGQTLAATVCPVRRDDDDDDGAQRHLPATTAYSRGPNALACRARPAERAAPARGAGGAAPDEASRVRAIACTGGQPRLEQSTRSDAAGCAGKIVGSSVEWSSVEERRGSAVEQSESHNL